MSNNNVKCNSKEEKKEVMNKKNKLKERRKYI